MWTSFPAPPRGCTTWLSGSKAERSIDSHETPTNRRWAEHTVHMCVGARVGRVWVGLQGAGCAGHGSLAAHTACQCTQACRAWPTCLGRRGVAVLVSSAPTPSFTLVVGC